jgi:hypothetical protein
MRRNLRYAGLKWITLGCAMVVKSVNWRPPGGLSIGRLTINDSNPCITNRKPASTGKPVAEDGLGRMLGALSQIHAGAQPEVARSRQGHAALNVLLFGPRHPRHLRPLYGTRTLPPRNWLPEPLHAEQRCLHRVSE